mgnify:CR=1 FL=1
MEAVSIARGVTVGNGTGRGSGCADRGSGRGESAVGVGVGVGVLAVDGVGAGVFTARGLISIPLRVSAGPCACGVALGVGAKGRVAPLQRLQKRAVGEIDAGILRSERMNAVRRDGETER